MNVSIKKSLLYCAIEYHWVFIRAGRKHLSRLYNRGFALSSPEMLRVNGWVSKHCCKVSHYTDEFKALAGIK